MSEKVPEKKPFVESAGTTEKRKRPESDVRKSWSGVLNPDFLGVEIVDVEEFSPEEIIMVEPDNLRDVLFDGGVGLKKPKGESDFNIGGVVFNDAEYSVLVRSLEMLERTTAAKTRAAGERNRDFDDNVSAGVRSSIYALKSKIEAMDKMKQGLERQKWLTATLTRESKAHGFAHYSEANMRIMSTEFFSIVIDNMLSVVAREKGWDEDQLTRARDAIMSQFYTGDQKSRVERSSKYLILADNYTSAKLFVTKKRIQKAENRVRQLEQS